MCRTGSLPETNRPMPRERGFTLVELVMIILIIGVLAVVALPRFFNRADYDARGFLDGTLSALHYAQKAAIAQRRTVCVAFTPTTVTLTIAAAFGGVCDTSLAGPTGTPPYVVKAQGSAQFATTPGNFRFLPSGETDLAGNATVSVADYAARTVTIDAATGHAY